jgi:hypothetical protein
MKPFKIFYKTQDPASINHTSTKSNSYRYSPVEYSQSTGNINANIVGVESEENKKKIKDLKKKNLDK